MLLLLSAVLAKPATEDSARLLLDQQGFVLNAVVAMPDEKGWFTWSGSKAGAVCKGSVEVTKAHAKKPKGRFSAACEDPALPDGSWEAAEECGTTAGGSPVAVYWTLDVKGGRFALTAEGFQTSLAYQGSVRGYTLVLEAGTPFFPENLDGKVGFSMEAAGDTWMATPVELVLNCSEQLSFGARSGL